MKALIESFRQILVKWHVAPLVVLTLLGYWTQMSMVNLAALPIDTEATVYGIYAAVVTALLGFMFGAFKMLLSGVRKEDLDAN